MSDEQCPICGNDHVDGRCKECGERVCDECLNEKGLCPNCAPEEKEKKGTKQ